MSHASGGPDSRRSRVGEPGCTGIADISDILALVKKRHDSKGSTLLIIGMAGKERLAYFEMRKKFEAVSCILAGYRIDLP